MNRFRLTLAFVFLLAASSFLVTYVAVRVAAPSTIELLWDILCNDGLYLAIVLVLVGLGWAYFGKIYSSSSSAAVDAPRRSGGND